MGTPSGPVHPVRRVILKKAVGPRKAVQTAFLLVSPVHFQFDEIYHVYNRTFSREKCFKEERHYEFFTRKLASLSGWCDILAYCLLPNHFHLLLLASREEATTSTDKQPNIQILSRKLANILSSYTQAYNLETARSGSLFQPRTKAQMIQDDSRSKTCFNYVHLNPVRAGLVPKMEDWPHSSFREYWLEIQGGICNRIKAQERIDVNLAPEVFYRESYGMIPDEGIVSEFYDE